MTTDMPVGEAPVDWEKVRIAWYRTPIDPETLKRLTERSDVAGFAQMLTQLLLTAGTGTLAYVAWWHWPWYVTLAACYLHVTIYAFLGLSGAGHELCHNTPFKTRALNDFFLHLVSFLSYTNFIHFRASHEKHHAWTVHSGIDLEVQLPLRYQPRDVPLMFTVNPLHCWYVITTTLRHARGILEGEWEQRIFPERKAKQKQAMFRWARILLLGHLLLAGVFIYCRQWPLLVLVTFAPFCGGWLNFLCGFTQHAGLQPSVPDFRLCCRTVLLNPITRFLYWHMNYHVEHHMYAAVPFYKLGALRQALADDLPPAYPGLWAAWQDIRAFMRAQKTDPTYYYTPPLPERSVPHDPA